MDYFILDGNPASRFRGALLSADKKTRPDILTLEVGIAAYAVWVEIAAIVLNV